MGKDENDAKELPNSWVKSLDDHTIFYAGLNFVSRNLLDSVARGTFMEISLGEATKLLDNIMANYSQWHTERDPTTKKLIRLKKFLLFVKKLMLL